MLSLETKVKIIRAVESGIKQSEVGKRFEINKQTVSAIIKTKDKILDDFKKCRPETKKVKKIERQDVDTVLLNWFTAKHGMGFPINGHILKEKANQLAKMLEPNSNFECSDGWIHRFKQRHNITIGKISGEAGAVSENVTESWLTQEWPKLCDGYKQEDIFNADETGLFYELLPSQTYKFKGEKCIGGKQSKKRITILLCANMNGSEKRKLLVIGKAMKPRCFKNVSRLPVKYKSNRKSWMTSIIFEEEMTDWDRELQRSNRKILLLVDNCPAHPKLENLKNIRLVFLPPNVTAILQPMDQGVIRTFKAHYRKLLLLDIVQALDNEKEPSTTLLDGIQLASKAWKRVSAACIRNCYRHAKISDCHNFEEEVS